MYCPECGQEYGDGVLVCADCGAALIEEQPATRPDPEPEWLDLETVLETSDPALLAVARSLLEAEGIASVARGDLLQEFVGWGRFPSGSNLITGPAQLQVPRDRSEEARSLLAHLESDASEVPPDGPTED